MHCAHRLKELHGSLALGVGAGVGFGVGSGVGSGVGCGVGSGVRLGVGLRVAVGGVGDATSLNELATLSSKMVTLLPKTRKRFVLLNRPLVAALMLAQVASKSLSDRP
jgi:hypothetical protein